MMWENYGTRSSIKALEAGLPDYFIYKCVEGYLFTFNLEIGYAQGDGNCLPNSVLAQLNMDQDPGAKEIFTQMYLRRSVVRHLIYNWEILGDDIRENVRMQYGRPDSEINGKIIRKYIGKGKTRQEIYGFSVQDWCEFILKDKSWCDAIFIKLLASMWGCRISVLRADNLHCVTYRYEGSFDEADIRLLYNGNPNRGHYSPIGDCKKNLGYSSNEINPVVFTRDYRKAVDLDERLKRGDTFWDLDQEKRLFIEKRGYFWSEQDKEDEENRLKRAGEGSKKDDERKKKDDGGDDDGKGGGGVSIGEDEMIVKKAEFEKMGERIKELEKKVELLEKDDDVIEGGRKTILMDNEMKIEKVQYESMRDRCLDLEKQMRELKGGEGMVIVEDKNIKVLEGEIEHVRKNLVLLSEGKELDVETPTSSTPRKRRADQGDEPPSKTISKMVASKTPDIEKELPDDMPSYEKDETKCKFEECNGLDLGSHEFLMKHHKKYHTNESVYTCSECGKGFITSDGHRRHMDGHNITKCFKCTFPDCTKTFTSLLTRKAHFKNVHMVKGPQVECKFKDKGCKRDFSSKGNMIEHTYKCPKNPDIKELKCDLCGAGGFYLPKRVLHHKRVAHGWN